MPVIQLLPEGISFQDFNVVAAYRGECIVVDVYGTLCHVSVTSRRLGLSIDFSDFLWKSSLQATIIVSTANGKLSNNSTLNPHSLAGRLNFIEPVSSSWPIMNWRFGDSVMHKPRKCNAGCPASDWALTSNSSAGVGWLLVSNVGKALSCAPTCLNSMLGTPCCLKRV